MKLIKWEYRGEGGIHRYCNYFSSKHNIFPVLSILSKYIPINYFLCPFYVFSKSYLEIEFRYKFSFLKWSFQICLQNCCSEKDYLKEDLKNLKYVIFNKENTFTREEKKCHSLKWDFLYLFSYLNFCFKNDLIFVKLESTWNTSIILNIQFLYIWNLILLLMAETPY